MVVVQNIASRRENKYSTNHLIVLHFSRRNFRKWQFSHNVTRSSTLRESRNGFRLD